MSATDSTSDTLRASHPASASDVSRSPEAGPQRGHHVELYLSAWSPIRTEERLEEAERWKAAGVTGSIHVYSLNLLLVRFAAVQVKGALSWKMRDGISAPVSDSNTEAQIGKE